MTELCHVPPVGLLAYPGAQSAALFGLQDLLEAGSRLAESLAFDQQGAAVFLVPAADALPPEPDSPLGYLVLPPYQGEGVPFVEPGLIHWLRRRHGQGTVLCSVCAGAFLLADTGLLDGRPATTHWQLAAQLQRHHPAVLVEADQMVIDDGDIITAAGKMAWVDLGLHLVARFWGRSVMLAVARRFLVDPAGREQMMYRRFTPERAHGDAVVLAVQDWLEQQVAAPLTVPEMARQAELGQRTFLRRFARATGMNPLQYLQQLRIQKAREILETTDLPADAVGPEVGYTDAAAFRRIFGRLVGLAPGEYRRRFGR